MNITKSVMLNTTVVEVSDPSLPLSRVGYLFTGIYVSLVALTATTGNTLVIVVLLKGWKKLNFLQKPHIPMTLSLAISDIGISFLCYLTSISGYAGRWVFNDTVCTIAGFGCFLFSIASLNVLVAIGAYRYITFCRPHLKTRLTPTTTTIVIMLCWLYALFWAVIPLLGPSRYTYEPFGTSCSFDWMSPLVGDIVFLLGTVVFCFLLHLVILAVCYYKIASYYRKLTEPRVNVGSRRAIVNEQRAIMTSLALVGAFFVAWSPYAIICTWMVFDDHVTVQLSVLPTMFAKSSCALNPILYAIMDKQFRQLVKRTISTCFLRRVIPAEDICLSSYKARLPNRLGLFSVTGSPRILPIDENAPQANMTEIQKNDEWVLGDMENETQFADAPDETDESSSKSGTVDKKQFQLTHLAAEKDVRVVQLPSIAQRATLRSQRDESAILEPRPLLKTNATSTSSLDARIDPNISRSTADKYRDGFVDLFQEKKPKDQNAINAVDHGYLYKRNTRSKLYMLDKGSENRISLRGMASGPQFPDLPAPSNPASLCTKKATYLSKTKALPVSLQGSFSDKHAGRFAASTAVERRGTWSRRCRSPSKCNYLSGSLSSKPNRMATAMALHGIEMEDFHKRVLKKSNNMYRHNLDAYLQDELQ